MLNDSVILNACHVSAFEFGTRVEPSNPLTCHFGFTPVGCPNEGWPELNSEPMTVICQLNLSSAPEVISTLQHIKLLTFFVCPDPSKVGPENGQGWCLRTYDTTDGLRLLADPRGSDHQVGINGGWKSTVDWPLPNDPDIIQTDKDDDLTFPRHISQTKIGGFATGIKGIPWWQRKDHHDLCLRQIVETAEPCFELQIAPVRIPGIDLGHASDAMLLARGTTEGYQDKWYLDWQYASEEEIREFVHSIRGNFLE